MVPHTATATADLASLKENKELFLRMDKPIQF